MSLNVWFCHFTNQTFLQLQANAYGIWDKIRQEKKKQKTKSDFIHAISSLALISVNN